MKDTLVPIALPACLALLITWALFAGEGSRMERTRERTLDTVARQEPSRWKVEAAQRMAQWQAQLGQNSTWSALTRIPGP